MSDTSEKRLLKDKNLYIIFCVTLMAIMGVASLTPAFPQIINHFKISAQQIGLLITFFTLPGIFLAPIMGVLADRYGRKTILIPSILLFGIGGFLCVFARTYDLLLAFRFLEGIGAASLGSINITLIGDLYSGNKRARAMGYNSSVLSIGTASYPAIGGALATVAWFIPFYLPLLAIPVVLFVIFGLKNPEPYGKTNLPEYLRNTWRTINQKDVWALFLINIFVFVILYGSYLTYFPLLLSNKFGSGSLQIGLVMSTMSFTTALVSSQLGRLRKIFSAWIILVFSIICYFTALLLLAFSINWTLIFSSVIIFGLAHGVMIPNMQTMLVGFASIKVRAGFMSINSMVLRIGQTLGPLLIGFFYNIGGLKFAFLSGSAVAVAMILITIFMLRNERINQQ